MKGEGQHPGAKSGDIKPGEITQKVDTQSGHRATQ